MSVTIPLTQGQVAVVDEADFEAASRFKWTATRHGRTYYAVREEGGRRIYMHRFLLSSASDIDHIDRNGLNNQRSNLRATSAVGNQGNSAKQLTYQDRPTSSRFKGVAEHRATGKWRAYIAVGGRQRSLACSQTSAKPPVLTTSLRSPSSGRSPV